MAARSPSVKSLLLSPPPLMGTSSSNSKLILKSFIPRILTKAKTIIIQVAKNIHVVVYMIEDFSVKNNNKNKNKLLKLGSLKLMTINYSCCSSKSQIMPVPPVIKRLPKKRDHNSTTHHEYVCNYDSSWNSNLLSSSSGSSSSTTTCDDTTVEDDDDEAREGLSGYLHWLEGKKMAGKSSSNEKKEDSAAVDNDNNEIDRLAEMFIAESYEKFRVEKEESYRRFQDMLARSL